MPSIRSNGVYRMDLAVLSLELKIVKASNTSQELPSASKSAPANDVVNSLWSRYLCKQAKLNLAMIDLFVDLLALIMYLFRSALYLNNIPINQERAISTVSSHPM